MSDTLHFRACIQRSSNDKCFGDTVDRISESTGVIPVPETDCLWSDSTGADADRENEEDDECQHFDPVGVSPRNEGEGSQTYKDNQNSISP